MRRASASVAGELMRRRAPPRARCAVLAVALAGWACGEPAREGWTAAGDTVRVVDVAGREHVLARPVERIVSLVPSGTRTLRAIGAAERLVGRTDFDTAAWVRSLPSVGGGLEPNLESLVALEPDLVIRFAGQQDPRTPARLDEVGIRHLAIRPDRIEDVRRIVRTLGIVTGRAAAADSLVAHIDAELAAVRRRVAGLPPVQVAYVLGGTPPWVVGPGTYIHEVIELAGGVNAFTDLATLYAPVSTEELAARPIDVILVPERSAFDPTFAPGVRIEETGDLLELPGPELGTAARLVAELVHPGLGR